ncbi:uncharacterized protein [Montipora capricornis]|uniref:uncharacterized protein n=1 Tax=Montipora capricornis TaxID=246305 RepID=UPI0035F2099E
MQWKCVFDFCVFTAISLRILMSQLNQVHSDDEFTIVCGLGDTPACRKIFSKYKSSYKHVRRKHADIYRGRSDPPSDGQYLIVPMKQVEAPQSCDLQAGTKLQTYLEIMREHCHLPQAALNTIMHWTKAMCQDSVTLAGQRIKRKLENRTPSVNFDITDCLDLGNHDPFQDCRTAWRRNQFINKYFHVVNLAAILSNDQLKEPLLHSNCKRTDGKFEFIQDGVVLSNHPLFKIDSHTLELILYSDEIQICNAVGTRVKKHKLLMFYYLLSNLPGKYRSVVDAINLYAVVRSEDVSTYGFDVILQPSLDDLKKLGIPTGNLIRLTDGSTIPVRASLVAYVADNPVVHQAISLKESVGGSFRKCRFCHADFEAMQNGFSEDDFEPRSLKKH